MDYYYYECRGGFASRLELVLLLEEPVHDSSIRWSTLRRVALLAVLVLRGLQY